MSGPGVLFFQLTCLQYLLCVTYYVSLWAGCHLTPKTSVSKGETSMYVLRLAQNGEQQRDRGEQ